nr:UDP-2,3-diacylglucosamine diphosphatase [Gammaproteobacteria bacterium]
MAKLFISDLHLSATRPEMVKAFLAFLEQQATRVEALFILGDLFDQWLGDDDETDPHPVVVASLARLTASGVAVSLLHGNHDFLLGKQFAARTGCELLPDATVIEVHGTSVLIMHGDTLCTDDIAYQALRAQVRDGANQARFLALPLPMRAAEADSLRAASQQQSRLKKQTIMDTNPSAVERTMREHGVMHLIHGHTHRPAIHSFYIGDQQATRIVLGDWYRQPHALVWNETGYRVIDAPLQNTVS